MEENMTADSADSATANTESDFQSDTGQESLGRDLSPAEEMQSLLAERDANKSREESDVEPSQLDSDSDKKASDRKDEKHKEKDEKSNHEGFQRRINKEVARRKSVEEELSKTSLKLAELEEKFKLMLEENSYLFERAQVDEKEEALRQREYSLRLKESKDQLSKKHQESLQQRLLEEERALQEEQRQESIQAMKTEVLSAAAEYLDDNGKYLFDPQLILDKILQAAESGVYLDAAQAAAQVEKERAQAWSKRLKPPPAPRSAASASSGQRNGSKEIDWTNRREVREDAVDFMRELMAQRNGHR